MAGLAIEQKSDLPEQAPLILDPADIDVDDKAVRRQLAKRLADVIYGRRMPMSASLSRNVWSC